MRSTHRAHSRAVAPRRKLVWATSGPTTVNVPATSNKTVDLLSNFEIAGASTLGITIMRTHMRALWGFATGDTFFQLGLIVGRDQDLVANTPNINSEPELDWMLNTAYFPTYSAAAIDIGLTFEIDLRAKRKMDEMAQRYVMTIYNPEATARALIYQSRTLVALP
jgi:hypothetical protein